MENQRLLITRFFRIAFAFLSVNGWIYEGHSQVQFAEIAQQAGIGEKGSNHGVSIVDVDGDGWEDIFFACRQHPNRLYKNLGDGTYKDIAAEVGLSFWIDTRLALWGDLNNDGLVDLFLGTQDQGDFLFQQQADHTFLDISAQAGMQGFVGGSTLGAMLGDVDGDGWLDIYCARHYTQNTLYRNRGDMTFEDITYASGATDTLAAMGALFFDYDNDQDLDIYLVHDANFPNILYQNDGKGVFTDVSAESQSDVAAFGMGVDVADINNDGWLDLYITNFFDNTLLLNRGDGTFTDITETAGVGDKGMGWGVAFVDVDNDGWQDIYLNNSTVAGNLFPTYPNVLYRNLGNETFEKISDQTVLASMGNGYGLACADLNQDGAVDMVVANNLGEWGNELFENQTANSHKWIEIGLEGETLSSTGIGSRVQIKANGLWQTKEVSGGASWCSQSSPILHFGLGDAEQIDSLFIFWSGGETSTYTHITINKRLIIKEQEALQESRELSYFPNPLSSTEWLTLSPATGEEAIKLTDTQGRIFLPKDRQYDRFRQELQLSLQDLAPGMYVLWVGEKAMKIWVN